MSWEPLVEEPLQHLSQRTIVEKPSERTLFNVHTIKDKPYILYFNLILIVNIMNNIILIIL